MATLFAHGYAVIVGVGADLPDTVTDAQGVANLLTDPGRCAYPPEQVRLLTGTEACRDAVLAALDWLADAVRQDPDSTAIVYFSGHGTAGPNYYLIPNGFRLDDLPGTAISAVEFTAKLRAVQAARLVVLLDCCHAAGQAAAKDLPLSRAALPPQILDELGRGAGRVVISSSRKDEQSLSGKPYSVFTAALLHALAGAGAAEADGYARVMDLALYVGRMVPNRTLDRQHPTLDLAQLENNFALAYYAGGASQPKALDWSPAPVFTQAELFSQLAPFPGRETLREVMREMIEQLRQGTSPSEEHRVEAPPPPPRGRPVIHDRNDLYRCLVNHTTSDQLVSLCHQSRIDTSRFHTTSQPTFARQVILHLQRCGQYDHFVHRLTQHLAIS